MSLAKGHSFLDQIFSQIGCEKIRVTRRSLHARAVDFQFRQHRREYFQRVFDCINRIEKRVLIFLHIEIVRVGERFHRGQDQHQISIKPAGLATRQFGHIGISFLRHQAGSSRKRIAELHKAEFSRAPDD